MMEHPQQRDDRRMDEDLAGRERGISLVSPISTSVESQTRDGQTELSANLQPQHMNTAHPREAGVESAVRLDQLDDACPSANSESSEEARHERGSVGSTHPKRPHVKRVISWWWWWEIAATILSLTSLVLLFILLAKSNGRRLSSWSLPIQPDSLIAVLTTVAKTSIMVPVASCLSQLKWGHFMSQSRPLNQFQVMDDASRGPWGSFVFLISGLKIRAFIPIALSFITVVALGIEPSAQQILDFPDRKSMQTNTSAEIGIATEYLSEGFAPIGYTRWTLVPSTDLFHLQSSIVDSISGSVFEPNFVCPSDYCTWEDFTTLGICSAYQNLTSEIKMSCDDATNPLFNCTYTFPYGKNSTVARTITFGDVGKSQYLRVESFRSWFEPFYTQNENSVINAVKVTNYDLYRNRVPGIYAYPEPPVTESCFARSYWCAQTFRNVTAMPGQLPYGSVDMEELRQVDIDIGDGCSCTTFLRLLTGDHFTLDLTLVQYLPDYLKDLLTQAVINIAPYSPRLNSPFDLANFLYTTDFQNMTINLATTLTNQIRSTNPGDNRNTMMLRGIAHSKEIYINVRWPWAILPAATVLIACLLLTCAMITMRKQPLLKGSALALLFHGLDYRDWDEMHIDQPETSAGIEQVARGMRVRLAAYGDDLGLKSRRQG
ncbi:hypothetical protein F4808DRAFT_19588 [Astrocystis sublimbata]|nr:hypothetical protein F4808DRAFT_468413 [Astrocystis sublimbata]KAI0207040.1 hypothetical protein F4808DRAFT_19588 [Astrocystis sublimbata]